jgi:Leucine-rich repeat (LRR) protein
MPTCSWPGITCDTATQRVTGITLDANITAPVTAYLVDESFAPLLALETISMPNNQIVGTLPGGWAALPALREVDLSSNNISGPLPEVWANASSIKRIRLDNNNLQVVFLARGWG